MPTSRKVRRQLSTLIPEGILYELGSGWGHLLPLLCKKGPTTAYELSPIPYFCSRIFAKLLRLSPLTQYRKDFYRASFGDADAVIIYLYPGAMKQLKPKLERELKEGSLVITHTFSIPGWTPEKTLRVNDLYQTPIYLYRR